MTKVITSALLQYQWKYISECQKLDNFIITIPDKHFPRSGKLGNIILPYYLAVKEISWDLSLLNEGQEKETNQGQLSANRSINWTVTERWSLQVARYYFEKDLS